MTVEVALTWNDSYHESTLCLHQQHPPARRRHASRRLPRRPDPRGDQICRRDARSAKKDKVALTGDDCREGLTCVLSVKVPDPKFSSQTKDKLVSSRSAPDRGRRGDRPAGRLVRAASRRSQDGGGQSGGSRRRPRSRAQGARTDPAQGRAGRRVAARQAGRLPGTRSRQMRNLHRRGRLAPAAAPSRARNRANQAVLPLRGKILNIERARFDKMLSSARQS